MLSLRGRVRAAIVVGLLYLGAGSIWARCVEICRFLVRNPQPFGPVTDGGLRNSELATCLSDGEIGSLDNHAAIIAPVVLLGVPVGPSAIAGFIISLAMDAIKGQPQGHLAHIGEEVFKPIPTIANLDASPAIQRKILGFWVGAARLHRHPTRVGPVSRLTATRSPMRALGEVLERTFQAKTSARSRRAKPQLGLVNDDFIPAGAAA